ncbi:transcription termination factor 3, mitochondrial [Daktulosphaira vitifoliae]|uniref:transcription termination factor 3, mitochondrial n=1 Tax=Daktulosphaira vitifoliae TaxID=58002 RepID=UPI0021AA6593|nr:transcription termination factor 3, mitochondrial [Daktulosphaira vitifoliae]
MNFIQRFFYLKNKNVVEIYKYCTISTNSLDSIHKNEIESPKDYNQAPLVLNNIDFSNIRPALRPTFNLASYVNESSSLQKLVKLGVELYKFDNKPDIMSTILKLDFERDMKQYIQFVFDCGVPADCLGKFFTKNPMIFTEHIDDLNTRINYLKYKNFTKEMISFILQKHPKWLSHSTIDIDASLGFFQSQFYLSGDDIRNITVKLPKLITWSKSNVHLIIFSLNEEMGFNRSERKRLLLIYPKIYIMSKHHLLQRFIYIHETMGINHDRIVLEPKILSCRLNRIKHRHEYLKYLNKDQYNPTKPQYVSLSNIFEGTDPEFCVNIAKTSVEMFNTYLKTVY